MTTDILKPVSRLRLYLYIPEWPEGFDSAIPGTYKLWEKIWCPEGFELGSVVLTDWVNTTTVQRDNMITKRSPVNKVQIVQETVSFEVMLEVVSE